MKLSRILAVVTALLLALQLPLAALALEANVEYGDVTINDTQVTHTKEADGEAVTENHGGSVTVTGTSSTNTISVTTENKNVNVTLDNVNVSASGGESAMTVNAGAGTQVTVELNGENKLSGNAGLAKQGEGNLTIQDTDNDGSLTAKGDRGAGIGGEAASDTENITITGGTVDATSSDGAGIGGGSGQYDLMTGLVTGGCGSDITISGGEVTAKSDSGAGIGGGLQGDGENITISGGNVTAGSYFAAGIGGGDYGGSGSSIAISGGTVTATSEQNGAGIGGGSEGTGSGISISGGTVNATGISGAGIGGGNDSNGSNIAISGGNVTASSTKGAGIGGGMYGDGSNITISGGTVNAASDDDGAGIGGGDYGGNGSDIKITGGEVTATSGDDGAGIGGGDGGDGSKITISGDARVTVGSEYGNDIGGGYDGGPAVEPDISKLYTTGYIKYSDGRTVYGAYVPPAAPVKPLAPAVLADTGKPGKVIWYTIYNEDRDISATIAADGLKLLEEKLSKESEKALTEGTGTVLRTCNLSFDKGYAGTITLRFLLGADYANKIVEIRTLADGKVVAKEVTADANGVAAIRVTALGDFAVILK